MKKLIVSIITTLTVLPCFAEWSIAPTFCVGEFFSEDGKAINTSLNFALVVDVKGSGFENFTLKDGDTFERDQYINSDNKYLTLAQGVTSDPEGTGYYIAYYNSTFKFNNSEDTYSGGEQVALVVWSAADERLQDENVYKVRTDDKFVLITPSLLDDIPSGDDWIIPESGNGTRNWVSLISKSLFGDSGVSNSNFVLDETVALPEPAEWAAIFGVAGLFLALIRRRK